jgi:hypothetical protein
MPANIHDFTDHLLIRDPESEPTNKNLENGGNGENDLLIQRQCPTERHGWLGRATPGFPHANPITRPHACSSPRSHQSIQAAAIISKCCAGVRIQCTLRAGISLLVSEHNGVRCSVVLELRGCRGSCHHHRGLVGREVVRGGVVVVAVAQEEPHPWQQGGAQLQESR